MKWFLIRCSFLVLQIASALGFSICCFTVLCICVAALSGNFGQSISFLWRPIYANLVSVVSAFYFSLRMGCAFVNVEKLIEQGELLLLGKVAASLSTIWAMVALGGFDLVVHFAKAIRAPYRWPDDQVEDLAGIAWLRPVFLLPVCFLVIGFLGRWCVGTSNFRIR